MSKGGVRPGAGRPKGSKSDLTKQREAIAAKALDEGITPLEVMLDTMRELYEAGEKVAACQVAKDAAPYIHPKLANTSLNHEGDVGMNITISTGIARDAND